MAGYKLRGSGDRTGRLFYRYTPALYNKLYALTFTTPTSNHTGNMTRKMHRIASIPGDGIGQEVVSATIEVVNKLASKLGFQIEFSHIPWGTAYYKEHGQFMSDDALDVLRKFNAVLFGAVGDPGEFASIQVVPPSNSDRCP